MDYCWSLLYTNVFSHCEHASVCFRVDTVISMQCTKLNLINLEPTDASSWIQPLSPTSVAAAHFVSLCMTTRPRSAIPWQQSISQINIQQAGRCSCSIPTCTCLKAFADRRSIESIVAAKSDVTWNRSIWGNRITSRWKCDFGGKAHECTPENSNYSQP